MKIKYVKLSAIKPYANNPRLNAHAVNAVARSIEEFGFNQPIVVDKDMVIIVGHTRYLAAKQLGLKDAPVYIATNLSEAKVRAYRIADNKTAEYSQWDDTKLLAEITALAEEKFDLTSLGFSEEELARLTTDTPPEKRELEDFETLPVEGEHWIVMRAPMSQCALALNALKKLKLKDAHIEYSGDNAKGG